MRTVSLLDEVETDGPVLEAAHLCCLAAAGCTYSTSSDYSALCLRRNRTIPAIGYIQDFQDLPGLVPGYILDGCPSLDTA